MVRYKSDKEAAMQFRCSKNVIAKYTRDECILVNGSNGNCHILNETAAWLLSISNKFNWGMHFTPVATIYCGFDLRR